MAGIREFFIFSAAFLVLLVAFLLPTITNAAQLGTYSCRVETIYGVDEIGKLWGGAKLIYDADAGTLDGSFDPGGYLAEEGKELPPGRLFSRLKVETSPSASSNLVAVQYDPVGYEGYVRPVVAWLMLETMFDKGRPRFQFFSNSIRVVAVGQCIRG